VKQGVLDGFAFFPYSLWASTWITVNIPLLFAKAPWLTWYDPGYLSWFLRVRAAQGFHARFSVLSEADFFLLRFLNFFRLSDFLC